MFSVIIHQNIFWFGIVWLLVWIQSLVPKDSLIPKQINEAQRCFIIHVLISFLSRSLSENKCRQRFRQKVNLCQTPCYSWAAQQRWKETQSSHSKEFLLYRHYLWWLIIFGFDLIYPSNHPSILFQIRKIQYLPLMFGSYIWWEALARLYKKLIDSESVGQRFINYSSR